MVRARHETFIKPNPLAALTGSSESCTSRGDIWDLSCSLHKIRLELFISEGDGTLLILDRTDVYRVGRGPYRRNTCIYYL